MTVEKRLGLFRVKVPRTTVRNEPGSFFIGSLFAGEHFYVEHRHGPDPRWAWGYGGSQFQSFGWVRLPGRFTPEDNQEGRSKLYAAKVEEFLKRGGHRRRDIWDYAKAPLPPPMSQAATRRVNILASTPFFLNRSHGAGKSRGMAGIPASLTPGKRVGWRYVTRDGLLAVVYHPLGVPVKYHGKWGFIKNDSRVSVDPPL